MKQSILNALDMSGTNGAIWGTETEDLNATLVRWDAGNGIGEHRSDEVDVVMVVLEGEGEMVVGDETYRLVAGVVVVIPKGALRRVTAAKGTLMYLNVHKRRRKLMPDGVRPKN